MFVLCLNIHYICFYKQKNIMNKYYVLQDENTGKYFTDRWGNYWDKDIDMAKNYSTSEDMDVVIDYIYCNNDNILDGVKNVILITIYSKN